MMAYEKFRDWMFSCIEKEYPTVEIIRLSDYCGYEVVLLQFKDGDIELAPIVSPTDWYMEYEKGEALESIWEQLNGNIMAADEPEMELMILNSAWVHANIKLDVLQKGYNEEMLKEVVHKGIEGTDLVFVPCIKLKKDDEVKTGYIVPELLCRYGIAEDEFFDIALENTRKEEMATGYDLDGLCSVNQAAQVFMPDRIEKIFGAGCKRMYILPYEMGNVHVVNADMCSEEDIKEVFYESRRTLVLVQVITQENMLSNKVYLYENGKYSIL